MIEFLSGDYAIHLYILIGIYLILAQSFNLTFGVGRLFNLAHIAAYAIGAYTTAILSTEVGLGFWYCVTYSMLLSGLFAILLGGIALKLEQDYFAIGTLAFSSVVSAILINWKELTRGVLGIPGILRPVVFGLDLQENRDFLVLVAACVFISHFCLYIVFRNRYSRTLRAQAEYDQAAMSLGINTRQARNMSFFISSAFAGLAGTLFAYFINYIDPSSFSLTEMIFVLTIVVVGGPGSFWGVVFGSAFLVLLPEPLRFTGDVQGAFEAWWSLAPGAGLEVPVVGWFIAFMNFVSEPSVLGPMRQLLYALILFGVVYINRAKLFPVQRRI